MAQMQTQGMPAAQKGEAMAKIYQAVHKIMFNNPTRDNVAQMLKSNPDPVRALMGAALVIFQTLLQASKGKLPQELYAATVDLVFSNLLEMAQKIGIKADKKTVDQAKQMMAQKAMQLMQGQTRPGAAQPQAAQPPQPGNPTPQARPTGLLGMA